MKRSTRATLLAIQAKTRPQLRTSITHDRARIARLCDRMRRAKYRVNFATSSAHFSIQIFKLGSEEIACSLIGQTMSQCLDQVGTNAFFAMIPL